MRVLRVLVCGSRTWSDVDAVEALLDGLNHSPTIGNNFITLIEGGAQGADLIAGEWAKAREHPGWEHYPADWDRHGRAAGPIRNQLMLDEGEPHLVVAFSERPITRGTQDMIDRAKKAGVPVWVVSHG